MPWYCCYAWVVTVFQCRDDRWWLREINYTAGSLLNIYHVRRSNQTSSRSPATLYTRPRTNHLYAMTPLCLITQSFWNDNGCFGYYRRQLWLTGHLKHTCIYLFAETDSESMTRNVSLAESVLSQVTDWGWSRPGLAPVPSPWASVSGRVPPPRLPPPPPPTHTHTLPRRGIVLDLEYLCITYRMQKGWCHGSSDSDNTVNIHRISDE